MLYEEAMKTTAYTAKHFLETVAVYIPYMMMMVVVVMGWWWPDDEKNNNMGV